MKKTTEVLYPKHSLITVLINKIKPLKSKPILRKRKLEIRCTEVPILINFDGAVSYINTLDMMLCPNFTVSTEQDCDLLRSVLMDNFKQFYVNDVFSLKETIGIMLNEMYSRDSLFNGKRFYNVIEANKDWSNLKSFIMIVRPDLNLLSNLNEEEKKSLRDLIRIGRSYGLYICTNKTKDASCDCNLLNEIKNSFLEDSFKVEEKASLKLTEILSKGFYEIDSSKSWVSADFSKRNSPVEVGDLAYYIKDNNYVYVDVLGIIGSDYIVKRFNLKDSFLREEIGFVSKENLKKMRKAMLTEATP